MPDDPHYATDSISVEPIAIIGLAVRVPGADDATRFWQNLLDGTESIRFYSREEQIALGVPAESLDHPSWVSAAPVLSGVDGFDAELFGMTRREVELTDPHHRIFLEVALTAFEDASYDPTRYHGPVGVYAGAGHLRYQWLNLRRNRQFWASVSGGALSVTAANSPDYVATTVSYKLNLRGPSLTVHTACSTSAVAVHLACEALRNGECDVAVAGGVNVELPHGMGYVAVDGFTSADGHCRPFDAAAGGTLWGSGAGAVVVKRLADALADGDHVRAVILGNAINNDGADKVGFSAPSVAGQAAVIAQAVGSAGVDPRTIGYVEAHGTGTALGDPIEVAALSRIYHQATTDRQWCGIGSVKGNIGHLSQAAGIIGLAKAVLVLENGIAPPVLHYERPNPAIDFENSPFYVVTAPAKLEGFGAPPRVGVSSFGVGGTNTHLVLEQAPPRPPRTAVPRTAYSLQLSAATGAALTQTAADLACHLENRRDADLADVAYTLRAGRAERAHRAVVVARDAADAAAALRDPKRLLADVAGAEPSKVAFLFPGQGAQYPGMGAELYKAEPVFAAAADDCLAALGPEFRDGFWDPGDRVNQTQWTQPALFTVEYALARLWESWGVRPAAMIGHSIGEYVAATLAGVFSVADAARLVAARGRLMQSMPPGAMLAVALGEVELADRLPAGVTIAAVNGPGCVVAGAPAAVTAFATALHEEGVSCRALRTSHAFHSPMMDPILADFAAAVAAVPRTAPTAPFLSNVTGDWITAEQAVDPDYWTGHLRRTVRFAACVATLTAADGPWRFLECGPGRQLSGLVRAQVPRDGLPPLQSLPDTERGAGAEVLTLYTTAGRLWAAGVPLDSERFGPAGHRVPLPTYPHQRQRYWVDPDPVEARERDDARDSGSDPLTPTEWYAVPTWRPLRRSERAEPFPACLLFVAGPRGERLGETLRASGVDVTVVRPGAAYELAEPAPARVIHAATMDGVPAGADPGAATAALDTGFFSALALVKAIAASSRDIHLDLVTSETEDAGGGGLHRPEHATLAGIARVAPLEVAGLTVRRIDVTGRTTPEEVVAELRRPPGDTGTELALRGGRRWSLDYAQVTYVDDEPRLRDGGCYLVTGGLGGVGITVAEDLAQRTRGVLVLLSRTALPDRSTWDDQLARHGVVDRTGRAIAAIRRMERAGATVVVLAADVAEVTDLRRVRAEIDAAGWPLAGIVHAAGTPGSGMIEVKDPATAAEVLRPKVAGTLALRAVFGDLALDFVVLCSSITAIAGGMGQVDYCAANAFQDAYARSRHGWRAHVVSVNWGRWDEVGMAAEVAARATALVRASESALATLSHPILTARREDTVTGVVGPDSHWVLDEHRIGGVAVLPGTAHLDCAREAVTHLVPGNGVVELRELSFLEPLAVPDGTTDRYRVVRDPDGDFRIMSEGDRVHAEFRGGWVAAGDQQRVDVAAIQARCRPVAGTRRSTVVSYGARWDCLRAAYAGDGEDLALVETPAAAAADLDRWVLHPALLDIATSFGFTGAEGSYLPLAYGRVQVHDRLPARFYSHLRYRDPGAAGLLSAAVTLTDPDGRVLVEISDFTLRRVDPDEVAGNLRQAPGGTATATDAEGVGEESISPREGARALRRVLAADAGPQVAVVPIRVATVRERVRRAAAEWHSGAGASTVGAGAAASAYVAPRTVLEERLVEVWQSVLGVERVGIEDDFFALGGNSLVAVQLVAQLRKALRIKLPMRTLFETPTVATLVERVAQLRAEEA